MAGYAGRSGMQWHADVTLASYVARKDDELTSSRRVSVVVVPLLLEQKLPPKFAIPLNPLTMCTRYAGVLQLIFFLDHTRVATNQPTSTLRLRLVGWPVTSEVGWLVGWWYNGLRPTKCGRLDHVHAAREGSDRLTPLLESQGPG